MHTEERLDPTLGFIVVIQSAGVSHEFYVSPDKSFRIVPPMGWAIMPSGEGGVEFQSRLPDQGYWPVMFIAKEPVEGSQALEAEEINALAAKDGEAFRFVSGETVDCPFGKAYLVIYEHTFEKRRMRTAEAHFVCNGTRYWVPFNALATTFDRHFPAYLNCLRTFAPITPCSDPSCN